MGHRIIVMSEKEELHGARGSAEPESYEKALNEAVVQMSIVGPRIFRAMKAQMMRGIELPEEIKELGDSQMFVLHSLSKGKALASELARSHNVTNPTMTRVIDTLVEKGYVERKNDPEDRRCIFLQLTEEGGELGRIVDHRFRDAMTNFLKSLTEEQLNDISRAYSHLATLLPEVNVDLEALDSGEAHHAGGTTSHGKKYEYSAQ